MASFLEDLWTSVFTPGTTPTLLVATNASFGALQCLLLVLLLATYSIHFLALSIISAGLWYAINWFARELQIENAKAAQKAPAEEREKSPDPGSDTETELPAKPTSSDAVKDALLQPDSSTSNENLRRRRSLADSSGYVSTDSEWEKISEGDKKA